jgi:poly-gamma-glutamate capsule biosynthesis protein CapA/YwtB (metallophosphatase superfamily)
VKSVDGLPRLPREISALPVHEGVFYDALISFFEVSGLWRKPAPRSGDFEEMRLLDKVYWFYKSKNPIRQAVDGSGLETFFANRGPFTWTQPAAFAVTGSLRLTSVGDLMSHPFLAGSKESLYRSVADSVFGADISMGNLECVVRATAQDLKIDVRAGPQLVLDHEAFRAVTSHRSGQYDFLAAACNHSLDFGVDGVTSTIAALRDQGIAFHGVNEHEDDADRATILERRDFRVGVVAHSFGLNGRRPPADRPRLVNRMRLNGPATELDLAPLVKQLGHCKEEAVDFVVAHLHWGMEFEFFPRPEQIQVAHRIAELGVDAIIGHHPHVLQPVEYYRTERDPLRVVPIFYSLGNLTNPFSAPYMCRGGIAQLELVKGNGGDGASRSYVRAAQVVEVDQVADRVRNELSLRRA